MRRFPTTADTQSEIRRYYQNRSIQYLPWGWTWSGHIVEYPWGASAIFKSPHGNYYTSVYVLQSEIGKGHLSRWVKENPERRFVTSDDCPEMKGYLEKHRISFVNMSYCRPKAHSDVGRCYAAVESFYGDQHAKRSGLPLMNHIDEGIFLLRNMQASDLVLAAFCLHPLIQADADLSSNLKSGLLSNLPVAPLVLAMEYRQWANKHLSMHPPNTTLTWGPLGEVKMMLIADKIQNWKDFYIYLRGRESVPNSDRLDSYFAEWGDALGITPRQFQLDGFAIQDGTGRNHHKSTLDDFHPQ